MNLSELPGPLQAVWNDVYQLIVKNLRADGVDLPIAKSRARRAAEEHVELIWDETKHPRWSEGTGVGPGGEGGGRWRPKGAGAGVGKKEDEPDSTKDTESDDVHVSEAVEYINTIEPELQKRLDYRKKELEKRLTRVEDDIAKLEKQMPSDRLKEYFPVGVGSGRNTTAEGRRKYSRLEKSIDIGVELGPLYKDRDNIKNMLGKINSGKALGKMKTNAGANYLIVRNYHSAKAGDSILVVRMGREVKIKRRSKRSMTTTSGSKWSIEEVTGLDREEIEKIEWYINKRN